MIEEFRNMNGLELTKSLINFNNYIRGDKYVSKSICKFDGAKSLLQSANEQSTIFSTGTDTESNKS